MFFAKACKLLLFPFQIQGQLASTHIADDSIQLEPDLQTRIRISKILKVDKPKQSLVNIKIRAVLFSLMFFG